MKRRMIRASALASIAPIVLAGAAVASSDAPTFKEFVASTHKATDGQYIVDGDIPVLNKSALRTYYDNAFGEAHPIAEGLIINQTPYNSDDRWDAATARNLTYCVSTRFGQRHAQIVAAMRDGAALWQNASSGVRFNYVSSEDSRCTTANNNVVFSVEPAPANSPYIARAFFPSSPKRVKNVLITNQLGQGGWSAANVLGHELGHVLGFRHEHIRPEAANTERRCQEPQNYRPITDYDSDSIMHYPHCNGTSQNLSMTDTDREGVRSVYGE